MQEYNGEWYEKTIGKILRFGFNRGKDFSPSAEFVTFHSWNQTSDPSSGSWGILDYIMVNETKMCTAQCPQIINFYKIKEGSKVYASDHKGLLMEIDF